MPHPSRVGRPGLAWAAPAVLFFATFALVPMLVVVGLTFTSWSGIGSPEWTGLDNWTHLAHDPQLWPSARLTLALTALSWILQTGLALPAGVWLAGRGAGRALVGAICFVPLLLSSAAIAILWSLLLDPNNGLASVVGPWVGVDDGNFIGDPSLAFYVVVFVVAWQFLPFHVLLYQGAAKAIPPTLYEAARIDGAGRVSQFTSITLPQLRDTVITSSVLILVGSLTYFDIVLILTGGGPGTATRLLPLHMYITGFQAFDMGYASVLAVVLLMIGTAVSLLVTSITGFTRMESQKEGM